MIFMGLTNLPKIKPSKGAIYGMAILLGTFTYFFTKPTASNESKRTGPS